jgi:SPP1 family predicted phage head-tail adaptor
MRAGPMRDRVLVQTWTETQNSVGEPITSWSAYATRWCQVTPLNGTEKWAGSEKLAEVSHHFRLRYDSITKAITPKMRLSWDSRTFDISSVTNMRNREIIILATEKA